jgi:hypothetical protein
MNLLAFGRGRRLVKMLHNNIAHVFQLDFARRQGFIFALLPWFILRTDRFFRASTIAHFSAPQL